MLEIDGLQVQLEADAGLVRAAEGVRRRHRGRRTRVVAFGVPVADGEAGRHPGHGGAAADQRSSRDLDVAHHLRGGPPR